MLPKNIKITDNNKKTTNKRLIQIKFAYIGFKSVFFFVVKFYQKLRHKIQKKRRTKKTLAFFKTSTDKKKKRTKNYIILSFGVICFILCKNNLKKEFKTLKL